MDDTMGMGMGNGTSTQNAFSWSKNVTILFSSWTTDGLIIYLLTLLAIFVLAMIYQWLGSCRAILASRVKEEAKVSADPSALSLEAGSEFAQAQPHMKRAKFLLVLLFAVNVGIGYLLMLCVMSFNGGVFLAVVLGMTVAYAFSP